MSLTHSAVIRFTQIWGKTLYMATKIQIRASSKKFLLANTEEVFSVRYRILSLKIDSLPSNLHTKRIHSDGKTIYSKTDQGARKNFFLAP